MGKTYHLMSKNRTLLTFCVEKQPSNNGDAIFYDEYSTKISYVAHEADSLLPFELRHRSGAELMDWIRQRTSPVGQKLLDIINDEIQTADTPMFLAEATLLLSLNDSFWIKPDNTDFHWENVNLYENPFNQTLSEIVFSANNVRPSVRAALEMGYRSPEFTSKGTLRKCWVRRRDNLYLLKEDNSGKQYEQSHAEWFAQQVAESLGLPHVKYNLEPYSHKNGETRLVSSCPIFTNGDLGYVEASKAFSIPSLFERSGQMRMAAKMEPEFYANMMLFDTLIGNTDRHADNYGCLYDTNTGQIICPAPLFDNGRSLLATNDVNKKIDFSAWRDDNRGYFASFKNQIAWFLGQAHLDMLSALENFEFKQHPEFEIPDGTFNLLHEFLGSQRDFIRSNLEAKLAMTVGTGFQQNGAANAVSPTCNISLDVQAIAYINEQFANYQTVLESEITDERACVRICANTMREIETGNNKEVSPNEILNISRYVLAKFAEYNDSCSYSHYVLAYNVACEEEMCDETLDIIREMAVKHGCELKDCPKPRK